MSTPHSQPPEDRLARAEDALRRAPVPDGPSEAVVARTLALLAAAAEPGPAPKSRRTKMFATLKIAAAVALTTTALLRLVPVATTNAAVLAESARKLREAQTLSYRTTIEFGEPKTKLTTRMLYKEPDLFRTEPEKGPVTVVDGRKGRQLVLDPAAKTAVRLEGKGTKPAASAPSSLLENLRRLSEGEAKPIADRMIGDVRASGFLVTRLGREMSVWIDPTTKLPLQLELVDRVQGLEIKATAFDFRIDPPLDDALFRTDPPAGYTLREGTSDALALDDKTFLNPERATEALLRLFAEKTGGTFPARLDEFSEFDRRFPHKKGILPDPETLKLVQALTRFMMATRPLKDGFGYRSEGVKLGDADKILFWYRPEGAAKYRALKGDLTAVDVAESELPAKPKR